ncbi:hypothetical protein GCM10028796_04830 [Ramlibacter monticola]
MGVQEQAIRQYAEQRGIHLVAKYEDEGRSGLTLKQRRGMQRLLRDVMGEGCPFELILVYDVSRWGRFKDTDESAYYEFHCRLNGVQVRYVNEPFSTEESPINALIKSFKRAMAAEYSRELGIKVRAGQDRAIDLGFHMGNLPAIGLRRMAVAKDPGRTRVLQTGERKAGPSEHIKWIPGPPSEVALVQRIFQLYGYTSMHMPDIVNLLNSEGIRSKDGQPFTETMVRHILDCESFIGNFVWSKRCEGNQRRRTETDPMFRRTIGTIEPIIDRETWDRVQTKRFWKKGVFRSKPQLLAHLRAALLENPSVTVKELPSLACGARTTFTKLFGSMEAAFRLAGRDYAAVHARRVQRQLRGWRVTRAIVHDLEALFTSHGIKWMRPRRQHLFVFANGTRVRIQLMWKLLHQGCAQWHLSKHVWSGPCDHFLIARMNQDETAQDFLLISRAVYRSSPPWSWEHLPQFVVQIHNAAELLSAVRSVIETDPAGPRS